MGGDRNASDCGCELDIEAQDESASRLRDDAYQAHRAAAGDAKAGAQDGGKKTDNPANHLVMARELEQAGNIGGATVEFKAAVTAADNQPSDQIKANLAEARKALAQEKDPSRKQQLEEYAAGTANVLALPFDSRVELAKFYARTGRFPEAQATVEEALKKGVDAMVKEELGKSEREVRAEKLKDSIVEFVERPKLMAEFSTYMSKLDVNENKFVDRLELKRAQLDPNIDERGQKLVTFMLNHYDELMRAQGGGTGKDAQGITKDDADTFRKTFEERLKKNRREK